MEPVSKLQQLDHRSTERIAAIVSQFRHHCRWGLDIWWGNNSESTGGLAPRIINTQFPVVDIQTGVSKLIHPYSVRGRRLRELSEPERFHSLLRESAGLFDGWIWNHPDHFLMLRIKAFVYFFTGQMFWLENNLHDVPDARFEPDIQPEIIIELPSLNFPDSPDETKIRLSDTIVQDDTGSIISETKTFPLIKPATSIEPEDLKSPSNLQALR